MLTMAVLLASSVGCRKQRASEPGEMSDTTTAPAAAETPPPEPADTSTRVQDLGFAQRQQFVQSIRQQLSGMDQQIKDLAAQAKSKGGAVSDRALGRIRASRKTVDRSLRQVDVATAANWGKVKQGVNRAVDDLTEAIESAQPK
jgi:DNA-binding protein YbaB